MQERNSTAIAYQSFYGAIVDLLNTAARNLKHEPPISQWIKLFMMCSGACLLVTMVSAYIQAPDPQTLRDRITINETRLQSITEHVLQQDKKIERLSEVQGQVLQDIAVLKVGQESILRILWALGLGMLGQIIETFYSNVMRKHSRQQE